MPIVADITQLAVIGDDVLVEPSEQRFAQRGARFRCVVALVRTADDPQPVIDGVASESIWKSAEWQAIDHRWLGRSPHPFLHA